MIDASRYNSWSLQKRKLTMKFNLKLKIYFQLFKEKIGPKIKNYSFPMLPKELAEKLHHIPRPPPLVSGQNMVVVSPPFR